MKKAVKIPLIILGVLAGLFILIVLALNVGRFIAFRDYYEIRTREAPNPGLNDGFVPQGITYNEDKNYFVTVGYTVKGTGSRLYKISDKKNIQQFDLVKDGKEWNGHTGGLQYLNGAFYLANESDGVYRISETALENSESNQIEIGEKISVNNHSSFIFSDNKYLYVGEFNDSKNYISKNEITWEGKTQNAIVTKYDESFEKPLVVYSIPNQIQGFAITESGKFVLSRSWSVKPSDFFIFDSAIETGELYDGAPLYILHRDNISKDIKGLPFSEDLDYFNGKVYTMDEAACDAYMLGKFYFDYSIFSLKID